jgi:hypothetical protein
MRKSVRGHPRGRLFKIDLTSKTIRKELIDDTLQKKFTGGRRVGDWLLCSMVKPDTTNSYGAENVIIFSAGLIVGCGESSLVPGAIRLIVKGLFGYRKGIERFKMAYYNEIHFLRIYQSFVRRMR